MAVEWLFKAQIEAWLEGGTANIAQKSNFKRTVQLLETLGGTDSCYKVIDMMRECQSLSGGDTVCRVI